MEYLKQMTDWECSSFPEGVWHECCVEHDLNYIEGNGKWKSDAKLAWCVAKKKRPGTALFMWIGVTFGGWRPYLKYKNIREEANG